MLVALVSYYVLRALLARTCPTVFTQDPVIQIGLVVFGCYGAYSLGANNVANVATFLVIDGMSPSHAVLAGGVSIALGVLTFSKGVMTTVGRGITPLDGFSAFIVVLAQAITVHFYALVGVPVSTSQAVVGAVIGIGLAKGMHIINPKVLLKVLGGWVITPFLAGLLAWLIA